MDSIKAQGEVVELYPFLLDLKGMVLVKHRMVVAVVVSFRHKKNRLVEVKDFRWVMEFDQFARANGFK